MYICNVFIMLLAHGRPHVPGTSTSTSTLPEEEERACPAACNPFGGGTAWTTNIEQDALVTAIDNSVRIDFFNSNDNCKVPGQPVSTAKGVGQATVTVNLAAAVNFDVLFSGEGEHNYEVLTVTINGVVAFSKKITSSDPLCNLQATCQGYGMYACSNQVVTVAMPAGSNTIVVHGTTFDPTAHRNAFFAVSFVPQDTTEDCTKCNA
jgi:hypothetical protein